MMRWFGRGWPRARAVSAAALNEAGGPWGDGSSGGGKGGGGGGLGPRNPWRQPPKGPRGVPRQVSSAALDDLIRRGRARFGGGLPGDGGMVLWLWGVLALVAVWLVWSSVHRIDANERGVVTRLGAYSRTLTPGMRLTLPAPFEAVTTLPVEETNTVEIGSTAPDAQNLMLTGDQNIVDLAYVVRWKIRDPEQYLFELKDPVKTIGEVAESAMRAEISHVTLDQAIGAERGEIADRVQARMQELLNSYQSGVQVLGVAIRQADPPAAVLDAFKEVSAAQQDAQADIAQSRAYAQQLSANASGEASAFDKVYEQYRLSPEVTRRRMYYETMEEVLGRTDKVIVEVPGVAPYLPLPAVKNKAPQQ